jgi:hypothetical protein
MMSDREDTSIHIPCDPLLPRVPRSTYLSRKAGTEKSICVRDKFDPPPFPIQILGDMCARGHTGARNIPNPRRRRVRAPVALGDCTGPTPPPAPGQPSPPRPWETALARLPRLTSPPGPG